jgi:hypothetical protein
MEINKLSRSVEPPKVAAFSNLLWADPCENEEDGLYMEWIDNNTSCSYIFG